MSGTLYFDGNALATCPHPTHDAQSYPNLLASVVVKPQAVVNRMVFVVKGPDGLDYYWSHSPRLEGLTPNPGQIWRVVCRIHIAHEIPPMKIHWVGGINDGTDP